MRCYVAFGPEGLYIFLYAAPLFFLFFLSSRRRDTRSRHNSLRCATSIPRISPADFNKKSCQHAALLFRCLALAPRRGVLPVCFCCCDANRGDLHSCSTPCSAMVVISCYSCCSCRYLRKTLCPLHLRCLFLEACDPPSVGVFGILIVFTVRCPVCVVC